MILTAAGLLCQGRTSGKTDRMKIRLSHVVWVLILGVLAYGAGSIFVRARAPKAVAVVQLKPGPAEQVLAVVGRVRTKDVVQVRAENAGALVALLKDEGDRVRKGEVLARIRSDQQQAAVAVSAAQIKALDAQVQLARQQLARTAALAKDGWATQASLDQTKAALAAAVANRDAGRASAAQTKARAREFNVSAPMAGTILQRPVDPGQVVGLNDVLFQLGSAGPVEIETEIDEYYADAVVMGMSALLSPSGSGLRIPGRVSEISPRIDPSTGGRLVRFMLSMADASFHPGRSVDVTISIAKRDDVLQVPRTALLKVKGQWQALVIEAGKIAVRTVEIVDWPGTSVIVTSGLKRDDAVVLEPMNLKAGDKANPVAPDPNVRRVEALPVPSQ
jgi:RND family efflux transporter MFP subunit